MEQFYPSEIARLVLGYLKEVECLESWKIFLHESKDLHEYCRLYNEGKKNYPIKVCGKSLLDILEEYCILKNEAAINDQSNSKNISETSDSRNFETPNKVTHNAFTKYKVNQRMQTQSVSVSYGQGRLYSPSINNNVFVSPTSRPAVRTSRRPLDFGSATEASYGTNEGEVSTSHTSTSLDIPHSKDDTIHNDKTRCTYSTTSSQPNFQNRVVQADLISNGNHLDVGHRSIQTDSLTASSSGLSKSSEQSTVQLPSVPASAHLNNSVAAFQATSSVVSQNRYTDSDSPKQQLARSNSLHERLNLQDADAGAEVQTSILNKSVVYLSSEITASEGNITVTTMESSVTPQYLRDPPPYNRAPDTNSPRIVLSLDRSQIASLTTPMKDKKYWTEEFLSPKRKSFIPKRRLLIESPTPKIQYPEIVPTFSLLHDDDVPTLAELFNYPLIAEKIAENINEQLKETGGINSYPALQDMSGSDNIVKNAVARIDPLIEECLAMYLGNNRDYSAENLSQDSNISKVGAVCHSSEHPSAPQGLPLTDNETKKAGPFDKSSNDAVAKSTFQEHTSSDVTDFSQHTGDINIGCISEVTSTQVNLNSNGMNSTHMESNSNCEISSNVQETTNFENSQSVEKTTVNNTILKTNIIVSDHKDSSGLTSSFVPQETVNSSECNSNAVIDSVAAVNSINSDVGNVEVASELITANDDSEIGAAEMVTVNGYASDMALTEFNSIVHNHPVSTSTVIKENNIQTSSIQTGCTLSATQLPNHPAPVFEMPCPTVPTLLVPQYDHSNFPAQNLQYQIIINPGVGIYGAPTSAIYVPTMPVIENIDANTMVVTSPKAVTMPNVENFDVNVHALPENVGNFESVPMKTESPIASFNCLSVKQAIVDKTTPTGSSQRGKRKRKHENEDSGKRKKNNNGKFSKTPTVPKNNKDRQPKRKLHQLSSSPSKATENILFDENLDDIPVISIPELSPSNSDQQSAFELFSKITNKREFSSPILKSLCTSAKILAEEGALNSVHVRRLDFESPSSSKDDKEDNESEKSDVQNRRSLRIRASKDKTLQNLCSSQSPNAKSSPNKKKCSKTSKFDPSPSKNKRKLGSPRKMINRNKTDVTKDILSMDRAQHHVVSGRKLNSISEENKMDYEDSTGISSGDDNCHQEFVNEERSNDIVRNCNQELIEVIDIDSSSVNIIPTSEYFPVCELSNSPCKPDLKQNADESLPHFAGDSAVKSPLSKLDSRDFAGNNSVLKKSRGPSLNEINTANTRKKDLCSDKSSKKKQKGKLKKKVINRGKSSGNVKLSKIKTYLPKNVHDNDKNDTILLGNVEENANRETLYNKNLIVSVTPIKKKILEQPKISPEADVKNTDSLNSQNSDNKSTLKHQCSQDSVVTHSKSESSPKTDLKQRKTTKKTLKNVPVNMLNSNLSGNEKFALDHKSSKNDAASIVEKSNSFQKNSQEYFHTVNTESCSYNIKSIVRTPGNSPVTTVQNSKQKNSDPGKKYFKSRSTSVKRQSYVSPKVNSSTPGRWKLIDEYVSEEDIDDPPEILSYEKGIGNKDFERISESTKNESSDHWKPAEEVYVDKSRNCLTVEKVDLHSENVTYSSPFDGEEPNNKDSSICEVPKDIAEIFKKYSPIRKECPDNEIENVDRTSSAASKILQTGPIDLNSQNFIRKESLSGEKENVEESNSASSKIPRRGDIDSNSISPVTSKNKKNNKRLDSVKKKKQHDKLNDSADFYRTPKEVDVVLEYSKSPELEKSSEKNESLQNAFSFKQKRSNDITSYFQPTVKSKDSKSDPTSVKNKVMEEEQHKVSKMLSECANYSIKENSKSGFAFTAKKSDLENHPDELKNKNSDAKNLTIRELNSAEKRDESSFAITDKEIIMKNKLDSEIFELKNKICERQIVSEVILMNSDEVEKNNMQPKNSSGRTEKEPEITNELNSESVSLDFKNKELVDKHLTDREMSIYLNDSKRKKLKSNSDIAEKKSKFKKKTDLNNISHNLKDHDSVDKHLTTTEKLNYVNDVKKDKEKSKKGFDIAEKESESTKKLDSKSESCSLKHESHYKEKNGEILLNNMKILQEDEEKAKNNSKMAKKEAEFKMSSNSHVLFDMKAIKSDVNHLTTRQILMKYGRKSALVNVKGSSSITAKEPHPTKKTERQHLVENFKGVISQVSNLTDVPKCSKDSPEISNDATASKPLNALSKFEQIMSGPEKKKAESDILSDLEDVQGTSRLSQSSLEDIPPHSGDTSISPMRNSDALNKSSISGGDNRKNDTLNIPNTDKNSENENRPISRDTLQNYNSKPLQMNVENNACINKIKYAHKNLNTRQSDEQNNVCVIEEDSYNSEFVDLHDNSSCVSNILNNRQTMSLTELVERHSKSMDGLKPNGKTKFKARNGRDIICDYENKCDATEFHQRVINSLKSSSQKSRQNEMHESIETLNKSALDVLSEISSAIKESILEPKRTLNLNTENGSEKHFSRERTDDLPSVNYGPFQFAKYFSSDNLPSSDPPSTASGNLVIDEKFSETDRPNEENLLSDCSDEIIEVDIDVDSEYLDDMKLKHAEEKETFESTTENVTSKTNSAINYSTENSKVICQPSNSKVSTILKSASVNANNVSISSDKSSGKNPCSTIREHSEFKENSNVLPSISTKLSNVQKDNLFVDFSKIDNKLVTDKNNARNLVDSNIFPQNILTHITEKGVDISSSNVSSRKTYPKVVPPPKKRIRPVPISSQSSQEVTQFNPFMSIKTVNRVVENCKYEELPPVQVSSETEKESSTKAKDKLDKTGNTSSSNSLSDGTKSSNMSKEINLCAQPKSLTPKPLFGHAVSSSPLKTPVCTPLFKSPSSNSQVSTILYESPPFGSPILKGGKPKAMAEFYRNIFPNKERSLPISPISFSNSSCTVDAFSARRQLLDNEDSLAKHASWSNSQSCDIVNMGDKKASLKNSETTVVLENNRMTQKSPSQNSPKTSSDGGEQLTITGGRIRKISESFFTDTSSTLVDCSDLDVMTPEKADFYNSDLFDINSPMCKGKRRISKLCSSPEQTSEKVRKLGTSPEKVKYNDPMKQLPKPSTSLLHPVTVNKSFVENSAALKARKNIAESISAQPINMSNRIQKQPFISCNLYPNRLHEEKPHKSPNKNNAPNVSFHSLNIGSDEFQKRSIIREVSPNVSSNKKKTHKLPIKNTKFTGGESSSIQTSNVNSKYQKSPMKSVSDSRKFISKSGKTEQNLNSLVQSTNMNCDEVQEPLTFQQTSTQLPANTKIFPKSPVKNSSKNISVLSLDSNLPKLHKSPVKNISIQSLDSNLLDGMTTESGTNKKLQESPVKSICNSRKIIQKSALCKKREQDPNIPAGVKIPSKCNTSKINNYSNAIRQTSSDRRKKGNNPTAKKERRSRPTIKVAAFKSPDKKSIGRSQNYPKKSCSDEFENKSFVDKKALHDEKLDGNKQKNPSPPSVADKSEKGRKAKICSKSSKFELEEEKWKATQSIASDFPRNLSSVIFPKDDTVKTHSRSPEKSKLIANSNQPDSFITGENTRDIVESDIGRSNEEGSELANAIAFLTDSQVDPCPESPRHPVVEDKISISEAIRCIFEPGTSGKSVNPAEKTEDDKLTVLCSKLKKYTIDQLLDRFKDIK